MNYILKVIRGHEDIGAEYTLQPGENLIGRSHSVNFRLKSDFVSHKQCIVIWKDGAFVLRNLSRYGTYLDRKLVKEDEPLRPGQIIHMGNDTDIQLVETEREAKQENDGSTEYTDETSITRLAANMKNLHSLDDEETSIYPEDGETKTASDDDGETKTANDDDGETKTANEEDETTTGYTRPPKEQERDETTTGYTRPPKNQENDETSTGYTRQPRNQEDETSTATRMPRHMEDRDYPNDDSDLDKNEYNDNENNNSGTGINDDDEDRAYPEDDDDAPSATGYDDSNESPSMTKTGTVSSTKTIDVPTGTITKSGETAVASATQANKTRLAGQDELNQMRQAREKRQRTLKIARFAIFGLAIVFLFLLWDQKPQLPEPILTLNGRFMIVPAFEQVKENNTQTIKENSKQVAELFYIRYPASPKATSKMENENLQVIKTFIGRDGNVPLTIILSREKSNAFLYEDFDEGMKNAKKRLTNISIPENFTDIPYFYMYPDGGGVPSGLRYRQVTYERNEGNVYWFGILRFFRNANVNYILRTEVPKHEMKRAIGLLNANTFLRFENSSFIASAWDGAEALKEKTASKTFAQFQTDFNTQNDPLQYTEQEFALKQFMATAVVKGNDTDYQKAFNLFKQLREDRQRTYYNKLRIRWLKSNGTKDEAKVHKQIRNDAELVFTNPGDARYEKIRRDEWDK